MACEKFTRFVRLFSEKGTLLVLHRHNTRGFSKTTRRFFAEETKKTVTVENSCAPKPCRCLHIQNRSLHRSHTPQTNNTKSPHQEAGKKEAEFLVPVAEVQQFIINCFLALKVRSDNAEIQAKMMADADYQGVSTHGLHNLDIYINGIEKDFVNANAKPKILSESGATAWVDGNNTLGAVVGNYCMDIAIKKAKTSGASFVVAKNSNHYGVCSWYVNQAVAEDMIGFSACNTPVVVAPPNSKQGVLGTNPLSFGIPACKNDAFILDLATSAVAASQLKLWHLAKKPFPKNVAIDEEGKPLQSLKGGKFFLLPFGGPFAYKGFGLSLMVETLCGILGDGKFGPWVRWFDDKLNEIEPINMAQCFMVIDPKYFAPNYQRQMQTLMDYIRTMEPINPKVPILIPYDRKRKYMARVDKQNGIMYNSVLINRANEIAEKLKVVPLNGKYIYK